MLIYRFLLINAIFMGLMTWLPAILIPYLQYMVLSTASRNEDDINLNNSNAIIRPAGSISVPFLFRLGCVLMLLY